ncbi:MAG: hypothetical protein K6360_09260 [Deltaproteobacteria bacterium]
MPRADTRTLDKLDLGGLFEDSQIALVPVSKLDGGDLLLGAAGELVAIKTGDKRLFM